MNAFLRHFMSTQKNLFTKTGSGQTSGKVRIRRCFLQLLKRAGYRTHLVGKWDCGMATPEHTPRGRGYESSFGYFHHANDYWVEVIGSCPADPEDPEV